MDIIAIFVEEWNEAECACEVAERLGLTRRVTYALLEKARSLGHHLAPLDWLPSFEVGSGTDVDTFFRAWMTGRSIWGIARELKRSRRWVCRKAEQLRNSGVALPKKPLLPRGDIFGTN